ncbi:MAG: hypothetical protein R6U64_10320 [Bacteroidales bacterium]
MDGKQMIPLNQPLSGKVRFMEVFNHRANEIAQSMNNPTACSSRGLFALLPVLLIASFLEYAWKRSHARNNHQ